MSLVPTSNSSKDEEREDALDNLLEDEVMEHVVFQDLVVAILNAIKERFGIITVGEFHRDARGWPKYWTFETTDRSRYDAPDAVVCGK